MKCPCSDQLGDHLKRATTMRQERAGRWAADLAPIIAEIRAGGATSLGHIASALNARGIPAVKGGKWSKTQVMRLLDRLGRG